VTIVVGLVDRIRESRALCWVLLAAALVVAHGPALLEHLRYSLDPLVLADDARQQIYPFFHYSDHELFPRDYLGDYILGGLPVGFRALYAFGASMWDAAALSKALPYALVLVLAISVAFASAKVGSRWSVLASVSLVLGTDMFLERMAGGLPRTFGYPLLAVGLGCLAAGRLRLLAALVPLSACFYPPASVALGLALALAAFALPARDRGDLADSTPSHRLCLVGGAAILCVVVLTPTAMHFRQYGSVITPAMVQDYPEAGPGGRYSAEDRAPFDNFLSAGSVAVRRSLRPAGEPFAAPLRQWLEERGAPLRAGVRLAALHDLVFAILLLGGVSLARRSPAARRMLLLGAAAFTAHILARLLAPYLSPPTRYVSYPLPLLALAMLPASAAELARLLPGACQERGRPLVAAATAALLLSCFGASGSHNAGMYRFAEPGDPLLAAIADLPKDALVAGWPRGTIENVPYLTRRQVFLSEELHKASHSGFVEESRRRMRALLDAYFATSADPLRRLRDEFGVTHLVVHTVHLERVAPTYFVPYSAWIAETRKAAQGSPFELPRLAHSIATFRTPHVALLDLDRLPDEGPPQ
jgi:hypothetical protein